MQHVRNIFEAALYLLFIGLMAFLHGKEILYFLADVQFLSILATSATTLSGLGVGFLGIMLALKEIPGSRGEYATHFRRKLRLILRRSTIYFLLSSFFAFLGFAIPVDVKVTLALSSVLSVNVKVLVFSSALSTILLLNGLLHMFYVCIKMEEAMGSPRENSGNVRSESS